MSELETYLKSKEPKVSNVKARVEMELRAQKFADRFFPDDPVRNKDCADAYLNGMYDTVELIYN